jgi:hypothetical protein
MRKKFKYSETVRRLQYSSSQEEVEFVVSKDCSGPWKPGSRSGVVGETQEGGREFGAGREWGGDGGG